MTDTGKSDKTGLVFDIQRFSVHDGPGIRTTVFLKSCPLRCRWCQNPEGLEAFLKPIWLSGACINCGNCYRTTSTDNAQEAVALLHTLTPQKKNEVMDACPPKAIVWNGRNMTVGEVIAEVEKDRVFYTYSGGCTLSGGEPLAQADFALSLLEECRKAGIHSGIETSLFAPADLVDTASELADQIFADCKIFDNKKHLEGTGQSNEIILQNLERLLMGRHAAKLIVRVPLIPGFTADTENITAIADFICARNSAVPCELLNYNPLAESKYSCGDLRWPEPWFRRGDLNPYGVEQMERFRAIVRERGLQCIE